MTGTLGVIATAGHVDHGKSALIVALTGIDPDRFEEEKRRGLTIDLGYAWTTLPSGREVGFVDVPGHERFIRNMLAGVGPVRLVLFDTSVVDMSHLAHDPVTVLLTAQLGGGTDIARAVRYAEQHVREVLDTCERAVAGRPEAREKAVHLNPLVRAD